MDIWKQAKREAAQAFAREREAAATMASNDKQDREHLTGRNPKQSTPTSVLEAVPGSVPWECP